MDGAPSCVLVSLATASETWQSSTGLQPTASSSADSSLAVDGNNNTNIYDGSCMATSLSSDPFSWWAVDLAAPISPSTILLTNIGCTQCKYSNPVNH